VLNLNLQIVFHDIKAVRIDLHGNKGVSTAFLRALRL
jgi:hypothetical protein